MARHHYEAGGDQPQIAGSRVRNTYKPSVVIAPGTQAAPQHFSNAGYEGMTGGKAAAARPVKYEISGGGSADAKNDSVHHQAGHHEVAHNETEKEGGSPQPQSPEYRQKFDISSGTRSD